MSPNTSPPRPTCMVWRKSPSGGLIMSNVRSPLKRRLLWEWDTRPLRPDSFSWRFMFKPSQTKKLSTFSPDAGIVEFSSQKVSLIPEIRSFGKKKHIKVELQVDVMSRLTSVSAPGACSHSWRERRGRSAVPPGCCSAGWSAVSNCRQQLTNRSSYELLCGHAVEPSVEMERKNTSVI